ncbi:MAG: xanthine dehydrogenase family protein subunit M [Anaerolineae bacterium]|nr:xanthine dehydrogenase family protein subunit M [Anaerolineae bacterium]
MLSTNTHILFSEFEYHAPTTVNEVAELLSEYGDSARVMAGGTDLLVQMKMERRRPAHVISLQRINELHTITQNGALTIGAATAIRALDQYVTLNHPSLGARLESLSAACNLFSSVQIMHMATLGGNLCNASPAADTAPVLLTCDATVTIKSKTAEKTVPLADFFVGPGKTILGPNEFVTYIQIPLPAQNTGSAFRKISRVVADISQVCAAVTIVRDGNIVQDARIALGSVAPVPFCAEQARAALVGETFGPELAEHVGNLAAQEIKPISDVRATSAYRRSVAFVIVRDALMQAWDNCG